MKVTLDFSGAWRGRIEDTGGKVKRLKATMSHQKGTAWMWNRR